MAEDDEVFIRSHYVNVDVPFSEQLERVQVILGDIGNKQPLRFALNYALNSDVVTVDANTNSLVFDKEKLLEALDNPKNPKNLDALFLKAKEIMKKNGDAIPEELEDMPNLSVIGSHIGTNCYEYALSGSKEELKDDLSANPGERGGDFSLFNENSRLSIERTVIPYNPPRNEYTTADRIVNFAKNDGLEAAGEFGNSANIPPEKEGFYRVAVYVDEHHDYHWVREEFDKNGEATGEWKGKFGELGIHKVSADPSQKTPSKTTPPTLYGHYKFAQYFYVPDSGLDVGFDAFVENLAKTDIVAAKIADLEMRSALSQQKPPSPKDSIPPENPALSQRFSTINYEFSLDPITKRRLDEYTTISESDAFFHNLSVDAQKAVAPMLELMANTRYGEKSGGSPPPPPPPSPSMTR